MKIGDQIKETKYLYFIIKKVKPKTVVVSIINKSQSDEIGTIEWYGSWRQYCFFPDSYTVWNNQCLVDVKEVLNQLKSNK